MRKLYMFFTILAMLSGLDGCTDPWDEHYQQTDERVNMKLWDAIKQEPRFSTFVEHIEILSLDTIFSKGMPHTLFLPTNEALSEMLDTSLSPEKILLYHISPTLFLTGIVDDSRRLQTLTGKYLLFETDGNEIDVDGIPLLYSSPLYLDGKYYELDGAASPLPNLYEYTALYSEFIKKYIDSRDSVFMDLELSTPIGFDPEGNTVYDSVFGNVNLFEQEYFPVSKEFRDKNATFILFTQEQYNEALDKMAADIGYSGGSEVSEKWQLEVLMPQLMKSALFDGLLEYTDLMAGRLASITGDTVDVDYENIDPNSQYICSNGFS